MQGGAAERTSGPAPFGVRLRALREAASLSQEELAARAHLTVHAVSALERGTRTRPYPHTIRALADALDASEEERAALVAAVPSRRRDPAREAQAPSDAPSRTRRLPVPATRLVARDAEMARLTALLRERTERLVTLTGTGGVGKTRLSVAAAAAVESSFPDGVMFVELAPLLDASLVLPTVADAVGAGAVDGADVEAAVVEHLRTRELLLVLDNFEHLLAAAPVVARLLEGCSGLTVLATSRAALRVRGEREVVVQPLAVPDPEDPVEAVAGTPAGSLFLERARAVRPDLELADGDAVALAGICSRLAGIPLALELAAARTRFLDLPTLLVRLDDAVAADGARDLPARQRTMRAALDWSYGLLTEPQQALLRLLAVFTDGCTLHDAEAVAALAGTVPAADVLGLLEALTEHSLVVPRGQGGGSLRYHLLEPVAQYGRGLLEASGEAPAVGAAHIRHFRALAEQAAPRFQRADQVEWLARVDAETGNMSAAMERALASGSADDAGRLGWALWLYWWLRGRLVQGRRLMEAVLTEPLSEEVRTQAEIAAATMAFAQDDVAASRRWWQAALERARRTGDLLAQANGLSGTGLAALAEGDVATAERQFLASVPVAEAAGEDAEWVGALTQVWLGTVTMLRGDLAGAVRHVERGLASARARGDRLSIYIALYNLSQVAAASGDPRLARRHLEEGLRLSRETGDLANLAYFLDALAVVESAEARHERVPVLLGAAQGIRESIDATGYGYYRPDPELGRQAVAAARASLGDDRYDDALDRGRAMEPDDAVAFGLDGHAAS